MKLQISFLGDGLLGVRIGRKGIFEANSTTLKQIILSMQDSTNILFKNVFFITFVSKFK
ncbi:hypothetical protein OAF63_02145 [Saprospiraceae bacterium]|jgi:hypothetical protein|nr:hypothetical protein [Saprospiraceae bacterium]